MESKNLGTAWGRYLVTRDRFNLLGLAVILPGLAAIWWFTGQGEGFGKFVLALSIVWVAFSFLVFLTIGKLRMARERQFYDSISYECGLPSEYEGRRMKSLEFKWLGLSLRPTRVDIKTSPATPLAQDGNAWRKVKTSFIETFHQNQNQTFAYIGGLHKGFISVTSIHNKKWLKLGLFEEAKFMEEVNAMVYENFSSLSYSLPQVEISGAKKQGDGFTFQSLEIKTVNQLSDYEVSEFHNKISARYAGDFSWGVSRGPNHMEFTKIASGSEEEQKIKATSALTGLVEGTVRNAYMLANSDQINVAQDSLKWTGQDLEAFRVDFGPTDLTDKEKVVRFEDYLRSGLTTIFQHSEWSFEWTISAYDRFLEVSKVFMEAVAESSFVIDEPVAETGALCDEKPETGPEEFHNGDDEEVAVPIKKPSLPKVSKPAGIPKMPSRPQALPPRPKHN